jgi:hypothetical protein
MPITDIETPNLYKVDIYLDWVITICLILLLIIVLIYACKTPKKVIQTSTTLKLILFSDEGEIVLQLGKTVFNIDGTSELRSENPTVKPILTLGRKLTIDWKGYALRTEEGEYELPTNLKIMPWQLNSLRSIIPTLAMIQITAFTASDETLSWQIFY